MCSRKDLGVFVYNHWLDRVNAGLYRSRLATVRLTKGGWEASVRGLKVQGPTARDAAEKLSYEIHTAITLADNYREVRSKVSQPAAKRPTKRSRGSGSHRSSPRARPRKRSAKARHRPAKRG